MTETFAHNIRSSQDNQNHFINTIRYIDGVPVDQVFKEINVVRDGIQPIPVPDPIDGEEPLDPIKEAIKVFIISNYHA